MIKRAKINNKYLHFKGDKYVVLHIAFDCETLEEVVVYKSLKDNKIWVRKHSDFVSKVDKEKYPKVNQEYRFEETEN